MRKSLYILFAVLITLSMMLASCKPADAGDAGAAPVAAEDLPLLRVNLTSYPDMLDPQKSSFMGEISHLRRIYEGLTLLDDDLKVIPGAAESWEYNDDATEVTYTLREGLIYSDGEVLNAKRFEYAIKRTINPYTAGEYAYILDDIAGAIDWRGADVEAITDDEFEALKAAVAVEALTMDGQPCADYEQADCRMLKIGLSHPAPYFDYIMGLWVTFPAREEIIDADPDTWWVSAEGHVGNGPFSLDVLEQNERGTFNPNPNYWGGKATYAIEYHYITDSAVAFEAYKNDELDVFPFGVEDLATIENDEDLNAQKYLFPGTCTFGAMFHHEKEPFNDPKIREAFAYAIDRDAWVADVLKGVGVPTLTWIPQGVPGYQEGETRWGYDLEKARQAIADSTYGSAENLPEITLTFADNPRNRTRFEWLAAKWGEAFSIEVALNPVEPTTYTALTKDRETAPQVYILGWCSDYPDPQNWISTYWKTGAFSERFAFSNAELDALMAKADATLDYDERIALNMEAQDMLIDLIPTALIWTRAEAFLVKPWVTGLNVTPQDTDFPGQNNVLSIKLEAHE
ncbi:MAG: peptide ABC transporter substrate-binding protein [Anaerolineaceae bacterium]|nr:peptide ABC transporter substrate-binding protein [Anaerolineaceae bacterium]